MLDPQIDTVHMHHCVERWQVGDRAAADELLHVVAARLEHLTRKMLRGFPRVREWNETGDVLQGSLIRLLNTLRTIRPESTRHFFNLAGVQIRRELLELARRFNGEKFARPPFPRPTDENHDAGLFEPADADADDADRDLWCRFHEAVDQLPAEEREVLGLLFYHGWTQPQIAVLFQVDERTVRRRWRSACMQLHRLVGAELPQH
jgi:RNA polymerase sigma-70 factor (ECF subfamily)